MPPKAACRLLRRCSAASVRPSSRGTTATAGAAALAIAADGGGRNRRWGRQDADAEGATAGPGAICRRPNTLLRPIPDRASPSRTKPPAADFEPVILPGESLSKFKDRVPSAPAAPPAEPSSFVGGTSAAPPAARTFTDEELSAGLPGALYARRPAAIPEEHEAPLRKSAANRLPARRSLLHLPLPVAETSQAEIADAHAPNGASLSDEDVTSLAEQLAEAKHEEAQADAKDRAEAIEAVAEKFVEPAELEELQEALDSDQDTDRENDQDADQESDREDDHEDAAEEADAIADEMHDEAMAAEASPGHAEEHLVEHEEGHGEEHGARGTRRVDGEVHEEFHEAAEAPQPGESQPPRARAFPSSRARASSGPCAAEAARSAGGVRADVRTTSAPAARGTRGTSSTGVRS